MKRHRFLYLLLYLAVLVMGIQACTKNEELEEKQDLQIEDFLKKNYPNYKQQDGIYHVRVDSIPCDTIISSLTESDTLVLCPPYIHHGDTIYMGYAAQVFGNAGVFSTSDTALAKANNIQPHDPGMIIVGKTPMIEGLRKGLMMMQDGEEALILFNYTHGYKEDYVGTVPPNSPLVFTVRVKRASK